MAPEVEKPKKSARKGGRSSAASKPMDLEVVEDKAVEEASGLDDELGWPNTFDGRYLPKTPNSQGWHLWRAIVKSFLLYISHEIVDRSRSKREVGG